MKINIGKIVKHHGIKGELKILSDFKYKDKVFINGFKVYVDSQEKVIAHYRKHQKYDLLTFKGYDNINDIIHLRGKDIYIESSDLKTSPNEIIIEELIGFDAYYNNEKIGKVSDILYTNNNDLFIIKKDNKKKYIPTNKNFIKNINKDNNEVEFINVEGLI